MIALIVVSTVIVMVTVVKIKIAKVIFLGFVVIVTVATEK